jgi:hypothetical protein
MKVRLSYSNDLPKANSIDLQLAADLFNIRVDRFIDCHGDTPQGVDKDVAEGVDDDGGGGGGGGVGGGGIWSMWNLVPRGTAGLDEA